MVTEHIFIPKHQKKDDNTVEDLIFEAVNKKQNKGGKAYSEGKHLIIFYDVIGKFFPNRIGKRIDGIHDFSSVWTIGLEKTENESIYFYCVTKLSETHSPARQVKIDFRTKTWSVSTIQ